MKAQAQLCFDSYLIEVLMRDLVGHDKQPSAFLVYLLLYALSKSGRLKVTISLREIADETGLSKSVVQIAVANLVRRELIVIRSLHRTATPTYQILQPWRRLRRVPKARPLPSAKARSANL